jgi:signal transduction histidine kinase
MTAAAVPVDFSGSPLVWGMTALSYIENDAVILLRRMEPEPELRARIAALPTNFKDFCQAAARDPEAFRAFFKTVVARCVFGRWINDPPLLRLLGDHRYWKWFDAVAALKAAWRQDEDADASAAGVAIETLAPITIRYEPITQTAKFTLVRKTIEFSAYSPDYREVLKARLFDFNEAIDDTWTESEGPANSPPGARYSVRLLFDALEARRLRRPSETRLEGSRTAYRMAMELFEDCTDETALSQVAELCAFVSAHAALKNGEFGELTQNERSELARYAGELRADFRLPSLSGSPASLGKIMAERSRLGQLAWNRYFNESMIALEGQLQQNAHFSIAPGAFKNEVEKQRFWEQICRSLCFLMLSSEVSIYRLRVSDPARPLDLIGGYCVGPNGREKSHYKQTFMLAAALDPQKRAASTSYRAADLNGTQDVHDAHGDGAEKITLLPDPKGWKWGRSILAVPLIVKGTVWGVIEFASHGVRHYSSLLRPQCEAVGSYLSNTLLVGNVFEALAGTDTYWSEDLNADRGKRANLCKALATVFNASALTIVTATRGDEGEYFNVAEFGSWPNRPAFDEESADRSWTRVVTEFLESGERVARFSGEGDPARPSTEIGLLIRLDPPNMLAWAGALHVRLSDPVWPEPNWTENLYALAQVVGGVVSNVTSNASWNREARVDLKHEYSRITASLEGIETRLRQRVVAKSSDSDKAVVEDAVYDLGIAIGSLRAMSETLLADVYDRVLQGDARLVAMKKLKENYLAGPRSTVSLTGIFLSAFNTAARSVPKKNLKISLLSSQRHFVRMDRITLAQVIGTLADNAAKYASPNSEITILYREAHESLSMTISNLGPSISEYDLDHIFDAGFRGEAAKALHPERGYGLGLGFAQETFELWNGFLYYRAEKTATPVASETGGDAVWHRLTLRFPKSIVVQ